MSKEIAFAKQGVLSTKDWDVFQAILHRCVKKERVSSQEKKVKP